MGNYSSQDYSQYYNTDNYWQGYSAWQSYYENPASNFTQQIDTQQPPVETIVVEEDDLELIGEIWNQKFFIYIILKIDPPESSE